MRGSVGCWCLRERSEPATTIIRRQRRSAGAEAEELWLKAISRFFINKYII
jgi:hypothetical protein